MSLDQRERIQIALMPVLEDSLGIDPDESPLPGERIDEHLKRLGVWDDVDLEALMFRCERTFGIRISQDDWIRFFNGDASDAESWERDVASRLTYEALAAFIAGRTPAVSFEPVDIAGVTCAKAGVFLGLREVVGRIDRDRSRFAPSTPIREHLGRSDLTTLWQRLTWMTDATLPPLRTRWVDRAFGLFLLTYVALLGSGLAAIAAGIAAIFLHALSMLKVSWTLLKIAERFENPLPEGIVTYGDLARWIADADKATV